MKKVILLFAFLGVGEQIFPQDWQSVGSGLNGEVYALAKDTANDLLYAGGSFNFAGSVSVNNIAVWNGVSWFPLGSGTDGIVRCLFFQSGVLYAGGSFSQAGGQAVNYIAKWDGQNWSALGSGLNGSVYSLTIYQNDLYAGGWMTGFVSKWDGQTWSGLGGNPNTLVSALCVYRDTLYAGGSFTQIGGSSSKYLAKWDGQNWFPMPSTVNDAVACLFASENSSALYVGGFFETAANAQVNYSALWQDEWSPMSSGFSGGFYTGIYTLMVSDDNLYAGGDFDSAGGDEAHNIAKWDGQSWLDVAGGLNGAVYSLISFGSEIYAGGAFQNSGANSVSFIARLVPPVSLPEPKIKIETTRIAYFPSGIMLENSKSGPVYVYDITGREVKSIYKSEKSFFINTDEIGRGMFIYKFGQETGKFVLF